MRYLKQNTATRVTVGPFLDVTDAKTPEVALTATNEHVTFVVDDGGVPTLVIDTTATASGGSNDMVHITNDNAGYYDLELTAAQTNYVGRAVLGVNYVTDHLPVFHEFMILPANVFDAWMGTDKLLVDAVEINSDATSASNLQKSTSGIVVCNAQGTHANTSTQMDSTPTGHAVNDFFNGRTIVFVTGNLQGQAARITDYVGATKTFTHTALANSATATNGDDFVVV